MDGPQREEPRDARRSQRPGKSRAGRPPAVQRFAPWQAAAIARQVADALRPLEAQLADLRARVAALESREVSGPTNSA